MTLSEHDITEAAALLYAAQQGCTAISPLSERYPGIDVADAYAIQQLNLARRLRDGRRLIGRKIGLTSKPMQTLLGVDQPDFGYVLDDMWLGDGEVIAASRFCAPRVEPEVAFLLDAPLRGPGVTVADVYAATKSVAVALEIVDSRIADWKLTLPDTVADNASSGAIVLGDWLPYTSELDLPNARAWLRLNGTDIDSGPGSAVMGDPAAAVAWLANAIAAFDQSLRAEQLVMSGSFTAAAFGAAGDVAEAAISGLGTVTLRFS